MIKVILGTNTSRTEDIFSADTTLRTALESHDIDYTVGSIHLDGVSLKVGDLDKTFAECGIAEKCSLISVVKGDAA